MNTGKWILANALALLLAIPLLASIIFGVLLWQIDSIIFINTAFSLYLAAIVAGAALFAWLQYRIVDKPVTFIRRYLPGLFLLLYLLVVYFIALISAAGETTSQRFIHPYLFWLWPFTLYYIPLSFARVEFDFPPPWEYGALLPLASWLGLLSYMLALAWFTRRQPVLTDSSRKRIVLTLAVLMNMLVMLTLVWQWHERRSRLVVETPSLSLNTEMAEWEYAPFRSDNKLTIPRQKTALQIDNDWPRLNGSRLFYPLYGAAAQAIYRHQDAFTISQYVQTGDSQSAYNALINGKADLIFSFQPSMEQREQARKRGVVLSMHPLALEALVFVTHQDTSITNLTQDQIQQIYSGRMNYWYQPGRPDARIFPYQQADKSDSQAVMKLLLMEGKALRKPLEAEGRGGKYNIFRRVAHYQNHPDALGYTFRYPMTQLKQDSHLRVMSIDGVVPDDENIRNGHYPLALKIYMVTAGNISPNTQRLINWLQSPQGQQLIADSGYLPLDGALMKAALPGDR